ncbi:MAG: hypothetical protein WB539_11910 [Planktothrix agardhii]|jgi:hypothetical protein|uniref:hypothetical protein n=1 Tax=Planktothrix agardhii TaxID=1160 RepID=UPI003C576341
MPSAQAVQVAADLTLLGNSLNTFSSAILPIASAILLFTICAWILKRFFYVV